MGSSDRSSSSTTSSSYKPSPEKQGSVKKEPVVCRLHHQNLRTFTDEVLKLQPDQISVNVSSVTPHRLERLLAYMQRNDTNLHHVKLYIDDDDENSGFGGNHVNAMVKLFLQTVAENQNIQHLAFENVILDGSEVTGLLETSQLITLAFDSCIIKSVPSLTKALRSNASLKRLHLISLEEKALVPILDAVQDLEELSVSYSMTSARSVGRLLGRCSTTLHTLILRDSSLLSLEPIVRGMLQTGIQRLDILNCDVDAISACLLQAVFVRQASLQHVCLVDLDLKGHAQTLLSGLQNIQRLKMHHTKLGKADVEHLITYLQSHQHIRRVDLDRTILNALDGSNYVKSPKRTNDVAKFLFSRRRGPKRKQSATL